MNFFLINTTYVTKLVEQDAEASSSEWFSCSVTESAVNCQSSYSHWVFLHHSLFVCSLNVQQSHSKWIIRHSKHIVLGQVMCCSSFVPAWNLSWISPLLSSLSQFAPDAPFQMKVSAGKRKTQRWSTEAAAHTGPIRINKDKEWANKISVLLLTSVTNKQVKLPTQKLPMRSWKLSQQVWCHQWCAFTGFYLGLSNAWGMPRSHIFLQGSSYSVHAQLLLFSIWWHEDGMKRLWFHRLKVFAFIWLLSLAAATFTAV